MMPLPTIQLKKLNSSSLHLTRFLNGNKRSLKIADSSISWADLEVMINDSPSQVHLIATCYSGVVKVEGKFVFGFERQVDVDEAAMWVTGHYYGLTNQYDKILEDVAIFYNRT